MIQYEVGKQYPHHNRASGLETCLSETNTTLFDILYYIRNPTPTDIKIWRSEKLRYGLYTKDDIPFFITEFPKANWNFDVNTNIFKVQEAARNGWLNVEGNIITLFLINANTNVLEAMRTISITEETVAKLKDTLEAQTNSYNSVVEVDNKMKSILELITTSEMIQRTKMITL